MDSFFSLLEDHVVFKNVFPSVLLFHQWGNIYLSSTSSPEWQILFFLSDSYVIFMNYYYVIPQIFSTFSLLKKTCHSFSCHSAVSFAYVSLNGCLSIMLCKNSSDGDCTATQTNPFQYLIILNAWNLILHSLCVLPELLFFTLSPLLLLQRTTDVG